MSNKWLKTWSARFTWLPCWQFIEQEIRIFIFILLLLAFFRLAFIVLLHDYLSSSTGWGDIWTANYCGFRLSLKSAGLLTLVSAAGSLILVILRPSWLASWRRLYGVIVIGGLTFLFFARIPYFRQFLSGFNQLIFNTFNDDVAALLWTINETYNLPLQLAGVAVVAGLLYLLFRRWLDSGWSIYCEPTGFFRYPVRCLWLGALYIGCVIVSFGGSLSYAGNVDWENSGVTKDRLLNEAILDDMQALYRAYELNRRLESSTGLMYTAADVRCYAKFLSGYNNESNDLSDYLAKTAAGNGRPYQHIFLILSESYANWPLLDKYSSLSVANGMKELIDRADSDYAAACLPNGMSTISAVMGVVTGLADANLYLTTMPEAYEASYLTSLAPQLKRLGYGTNFWYAGPASWERVQDFSLAQGFDNFYSRGDYPEAEGNVWGCDDEYLYAAVLGGTAAGEKTFSLILNVANHSPYTVDLDKAGFPAESVRAALPEQARDDEYLIRQLGHYWYADKQLAAFIAQARIQFPDSLFIVVGDHADRMNIDKTPSMYERYAVPLIISGRGVTKDTLPDNAAGSQIDIVPTVIELAAPDKFVYYSIGKSMTRGNDIGVNYGFWLTADYIGQTDIEPLSGETVNSSAVEFDAQQINMQVNAVRALSWYIGKYGLVLEK